MTGADKAFETLSPNVVVDGPSSRLTSNDENATILFHEFVPVCVRERANSSEHVENLKIRIAFGFNKQKQNKVRANKNLFLLSKISFALFVTGSSHSGDKRLRSVLLSPH